MLDTVPVYLYDWSPQDIEKLNLITPKTSNDLSLVTFGDLFVDRPIGTIGNNVVWLCQCNCGRECARLASELHKNSNCGCKSKQEWYKFWKKNKKKFHKRWQVPEVFNKQCYSLRDNRKHLNRIRQGEKLGPDNFFWSDSTEQAHILHDKVVDILVIEEGLTRQAAKEKAVLMNKKKKLKFLSIHKARQAKVYDLKFLQKYGKTPDIGAKETKQIRLPTKALYTISKILEASKYDELNLRFFFNKDRLQCQLARLAQPLTWNPEKEDWDI